jgi:RNA polymerase sigma-70 factor (ECF subfamily)
MTPAEHEKHDRFLRLYVEHEEALHGFVRSLAPTREDAREVMQEVAVVLWRKFEELADPPREFRPWAFGVARFKTLSFLRDRARDRHILGEEALALLAADAASATDGFAAERQALDECLDKLPAPQRALVDAAYAPDARIDALAAESGRTPMALYKALHRIRLALMDCTGRALAREGAAG